jgi:hypothetical protein
MICNEAVLAQLDAADISAQQWRTARRILDRAHPENGYARISYEEMAVVVGSDSEHTVRGHLAALAAAGLITYRRNSAIHIHWHLDDASAARANCSVPRAESSAARAPAPPVAPETEDPARAARANCSVPRAESSAARANCSVPRAALTTTTGKQASKQEDTASLPAGKGSGENQPQPLSDEAQRTVAMLTDLAIGLDEAAARRIASKHAFGPVLAQCCRYLRDLAAGKVDGPSVIGYRLAQRYGASVIPTDHHSVFWQRHGLAASGASVAEQADAEAAAAAARRRRYAPPELAGIVIGADDSNEGNEE